MESSPRPSRAVLEGVTFTRLPPSPAAVGHACNFISRHKPFDMFEFGQMVSSIVYQIENGAHTIAVKDGELVAYVGWIVTTAEIAEAWVKENGPLLRAEGNAVGVTILATEHPELMMRLIHEAKKLNLGNSVYWKRQFIDGRTSTKRAVRKKGTT